MINREEIIHVAPGTVLMTQGKIGHSAYLLLQGHLLVEKMMPNGEKVIVAQIKPLNIIGELAIFDGLPRSATVTALEYSQVIELKKHKLKMTIHKSPAIAEIIIKLLCNKLRKSAPTL